MKLLNLKPLHPELNEYGLVVGEHGFVITENDFIHAVYHSLEEEVNFTVGCKKIHVGLEALLLYASDDINLSKWGHYWGIKDRVHHNYLLLQGSCREIGATETWPEWGAK